MGKETRLRRMCHGCGGKNKPEPEELVQGMQCGACRMPLDGLNEPMPVDRYQLEEVALGLKVPILIEFMTAWSPQSKQLRPEIEKLALRVAGKALVTKFDAEEDPELATRMGVTAVPTIIIMKRGEVFGVHAGMATYRQMEDWLKVAMRS